VLSIPNYERFGLRLNPFDPVVAEERPPDLLVIVGDDYKKIQNIIKARFAQAVEMKTLNFVLLKGRRGTGKSAIIRDFLINKSQDAQKIYFRLDRVANFTLTIVCFIKELLNQYENIKMKFADDNIIKDILEKDISEINYDLNTLIDKLMNLLLSFHNTKPLVIVWDQIENLTLEEDEVKFFLNFIRNISDLLPKKLNVGILFIISTVPEKYNEIKNLIGAEEVFIRNLESGTVETPTRLQLNDVFELFKVLLNKVRILNEEIKSKLKIYPYYPFTEDAIKAIYDLSDGLPATIYEIAKRVLDEAAAYPAPLIEVIDEKFVHDRILEISSEWYRALSLPIVSLEDILDLLLEASKELELIRDYQRLTKSLDSYPYIIEAFGLTRGNIPPEEMEVISKKHIIDYIVIYERDGKYYLTMIRTAKITIRSDIAKAISALLRRIVEFRYGTAPIEKERLKYVLLTYGVISRTVRSILEQASITSAIPIEILEINTNSPYIYGRIRSVYERIKNLRNIYGKIKAIPLRSRLTLINDISDVLYVLGIIKE